MPSLNAPRKIQLHLCYPKTLFAGVIDDKLSEAKLNLFASTCQGDPTRRTKRKRPSFEEEMDDVEAQHWKKLRMIDIQQALEKMFGAGTQFRGLQKPALEAIMKHESPILVVMGTGVGKSMLFQIPAKSVSSGTTIVITPLVSLQDFVYEVG